MWVPLEKERNTTNRYATTLRHGKGPGRAGDRHASWPLFVQTGVLFMAAVEWRKYAVVQ